MNIRKLGATLMGATMAAATFVGPAMAAELQNYPAPFVDNGSTNFLIVVGANANPADIVGATNVAVRLGAERGENVAVTGGTTVVSGGEDKELGLNEAMSTFGTLKHNKLAGFQHGKVRWNSKDVDVDEEMTVTGLDIITSNSDKDLGDDIYLGTGSANYASFAYSYVIDDTDFDYTLVNTTASKKLDIKFLGKDLEVTAVTNASTDTITFKFATDTVLGVGETATVDGKTVKVNSIGSGSASITVGTETKIIASGDEYDFGTVKVQVNSILYTDDVSSRQVDLSVGTDIEKTVSDGESMEVFGEPDDENEAEWLWSITADDADTSKLTIGAKFNQKLLDHKDDLRTVGEYFYLPNNYSKVSINSLNTDDYVTIKGDFDNYMDVDKNEAGADTTAYTSKDGFVLTSNKADTGFRVNVSGTWVETDKVYFLEQNSTTVIGAYDDADNKVRIFYLGNTTSYTVSDQLQLYYQDTTLDITFANSVTALALTVKEGVEGDVVWDVDLASEQLGATSATAEAADLTVNAVNKGTVEEDYRTQYGFIIRDPKSNGDSDQLEMDVPSEQLKATVVVEGPQASVSTTSGSTVKKAVPIVDNIAKLDTEVTDSIKMQNNLILVGGPCVNLVTAQALGFDKLTCGADSTIPQNAAMIKLVNGAFTTGKAALVVAGWDAENTRAACTVLQKFSTYSADLKGLGVEVDGTTTPTLKPLVSATPTGNTTTNSTQ